VSFALDEDQEAICDSVRQVCRRFSDTYWLERDTDGEFPSAFHRAMADAGFLGITMPEEYGGSGLGVTEAALMMIIVASSGGGFAASSTLHINLFGPHPIVVFGTSEQKARWLAPLIEGREKTCFGVTEPDAGLDTTSITTRATREGKGYRVFGRKMWTSTAQVADIVAFLASPRSAAITGDAVACGGGTRGAIYY
jgi:acyl-CoA dehydrogenase